MGAGLIPNEGLAITLQELLGVVPVSILPWRMVLFKNNLAPGQDTVLADLVPCDFGGYVPATLSREGWTAPTVAGGCAHSTWGTDPIVWTVTSGPSQTVFGYAFVDIGAGVLRFIQRFDDDDLAPIEIPGTVKVLPEYTLTSAECE